MLAEARALGEVRIALARGVADLSGLEIALAKALGIGDAIAALVRPRCRSHAPTVALGAVISNLVVTDMKIGLGWGLTLRQALDHLSERAAKAVTVVSLVGGVTHVGSINPAEFARGTFARAYNADCYLIPAPALVDSAETRRSSNAAASPKSTNSLAASTQSCSASARSTPVRQSSASALSAASAVACSNTARSARRSATSIGRRAVDRPSDQRAGDVGAAGVGCRRAHPG